MTNRTNGREPSHHDEPERPPKKHRTRRAIIDAARRLLEEGKVPSVPDAAEAASMSRATGYRYFSSQHDLLTALMDELMTEVREAVDAAPEDPIRRLESLVRADYQMRSRYERAFRTRLQLAVRQRGEAGQGDAMPRGWRIPAIADVLRPLVGELSPDRLRRLEIAISVLVGTEAFLILKDLWDLSGQEAEEVLVWATLALAEAAQA